MRSIRRVGGMAVAGILLSSFVGGPAGAQTIENKVPETYLGSAAGNALTLKVGPVNVSAGVSSARLDSTLKAVSDSAGSLGLPLLGGANATKAQVTGNNTLDQKPQVCATPALPAPISTLVQAGAACSSSLAEVNNGNPRAVGTASVFNLDVTANTVLSQLPITTVTNQLTPVLGTLDGINQTVKAATGVSPNLQVGSTVGQLLTALQSVKTLDVDLGASTSSVTASGDTVTSVATSEAGRIALLPVELKLADGTVKIQPIVEIIIGSAKATAVYNRATGVSTPSFDPAIATIRVNTPTTNELGKVTGIPFQEIKIAPDLAASNLGVLTPALAAVVTACPDAPNEFCILHGTPFETRLAIASGRTVTNADGSVGAIADAVKVHALKNIGTVAPALNGGILLQLAHTEAGVGGKPAQFVEVALPEIPRSLPRTGGTPWLPVAGVAGLAMAFFTRRAIVRSH